MQRLLTLALCTLCTAIAACASTDEGEQRNEQRLQDAAADSATGSGGARMPGGSSGGARVQAGGAAGSPLEAGADASSPSDASDGATSDARPLPVACAAGVSPDSIPWEQCSIYELGLCFEDAHEACACAGCPSSRCQVLTSLPAQIGCLAVPENACDLGWPRQDAGNARQCSFTSNELCFDDAEAACLCAGCPYPCGMTRSLPGQVLPCGD